MYFITDNRNHQYFALWTLLSNLLLLEKFDLRTYEYHEMKDSKPFGFVFGLFPLGNVSIETV